MKHTEYVDDIVRNVALKLREMINNKTITKVTGGVIDETVVTVAVNKSNGKLYYGISGFKNPTRRSMEENAKWLTDRLNDVGESVEFWSLDNCGEFNAINSALHDDATPENLYLYSVNIKGNGSFKEPCLNCQNLYGEYVHFIDE